MATFRDIEPGDRIRLKVKRGGLNPPPKMFKPVVLDPPLLGTVDEVDEESVGGWRQIFVKWDDGQRHGVVLEPDDLFDAHREGIPK